MNNRSHASKVTGAMPCGNPRRFESRDVVRMGHDGTHGRKRKATLDADDTLETEGEKHLQTLLKHQLNTDVTLSEQISQQRHFTPATSHAPGVDKLTGVHAFQDYKQVNDLDAKIEYLRHCGLDDEEVTLKLKEDMKEEIGPSAGGYGADPQTRLEKLKEIDRKIHEKTISLQTPDTFKGSLELSRQALDLEKSLAQRHGKELLLPSAMTTQKRVDSSHPDDPINHLPEILNSIEGKAEREPRRDRRKRRKLDRRKQYYAALSSEDDDNKDNVNDTNLYNGVSRLPSGSVTKMDTDDNTAPICTSAGSLNLNPLQSAVLKAGNTTLDKSNKFIIESDIEKTTDDYIADHVTSEREIENHKGPSGKKTIKEISPAVQILTRDEIVKNRLSLDEIKEMPKFKKYTEGEPNKIVYVKNLPSKTSEEDLVSLFGCFQSSDKPKIVFKLLTGRMKGQAFITFPDVSTAREAVRLVNGFKLKDQPIILSYGKRQ